MQNKIKAISIAKSSFSPDNFTVEHVWVNTQLPIFSNSTIYILKAFYESNHINFNVINSQSDLVTSISTEEIENCNFHDNSKTSLKVKLIRALNDYIKFLSN